ncbi:MAG: phytoene desaturase [Deltaproteobacteria bacterium]|nr:MAG: phytoene desaturase [Deltaproteobacteria bacterium]
MSARKAIVIGSGLGGLAAAVRLRHAGWDTTVVEAMDQPGGRAAVFREAGFSFDAGPTVVTAPYLIDELFELVGRERSDYFDIVPVDPFYRVCFPDGSTFDYVGDEERILEQIEQFNPADVEGYRRLADHARRIFAVGYEELVDVPFDSAWDMIRIIPQMMKLSSHRTVYGLVSSYIRDERLRQVFTFQPLLVGGNPFNTTSIYMLIHWLERKWGVHFAIGGTTSIVHGLVRLLADIGVEVRCNAPVAEIPVEDGRATGVRLESGEFLPADIVVSNADPSFVYTKLIDPAHRRKHTDRAIARKKQSMSLFVIYFGAKKTWPELAHHMIILGPRYRELLDDIFEKKVLAEDFSLYLHAPTRTDPSLAPDGHEAFYVLSPVPNNRSGLDWDELREEYCDRILDFLDRTHLPGLKENLVVKKVVDPDYFQGTLRSVDGAAFGLEPRLTQSAYFRFHNRSEDVEQLYFVGAGTHPGAGMPGVISSAKATMRVLPELSAEERLPVPSGTRDAAE